MKTILIPAHKISHKALCAFADQIRKLLSDAGIAMPESDEGEMDETNLVECYEDCSSDEEFLNLFR